MVSNSVRDLLAANDKRKILDLGSADWHSFVTHADEYNRTLWELSMSFQETYMSLIRTIRAFAYPTQVLRPLGLREYSPVAIETNPAMPIFVMRPLRGQLEQDTYEVVRKLRMEGDTSLFWLNTSGWLDMNVDFAGGVEDQDFFLDKSSTSEGWRLTERGHQRVAILLHMHVCQYLARDIENCAFLPSEIYEGKPVDSEA
jgi:hypothetical protein